jgi:hypothetical protein
MKRRAFLLALFPVSAVAAPKPIAPDEFTQKLIDFHWAFNKFERDYFDCPNQDNCPVDGAHHIDYGLFNKSRKAAAKLYDF